MNNTDYTIRLAAHHELPHVVVLINTSFALAYSHVRHTANSPPRTTLTKLHHSLSQGCSVLVCVPNTNLHHIIGTILFPSHHVDFDSAKRTDTESFGSLAVSSACQGQGIGSMLVRAVETRAKAQGKTRMELCFAHGTLLSGRPRLGSFYTKLGYTAGAVKHRTAWYDILPTFRKGLYFQQMVKQLDSPSPPQPKPHTNIELIQWIKDYQTNGNDLHGEPNQWDISDITDLSNVFNNNTTFNAPLSNWDTSSVTSMSNLFRNATSFNQDISTWDTSKVVTLSNCFERAVSFNQPIGKWSTQSLVDLGSCFEGASAFNQPLKQWNTSNVQTLSKCFRSATVFNQPLDDNRWVVGHRWTFVFTQYTAKIHGKSGARRLVRKLPGFLLRRIAYCAFGEAGGWDTSSVVDMSCCFMETCYNQPIGQWDIANCTNLSFVFCANVAFDQNINCWNVRNVVSLNSTWNGASSFNSPLNRWCTDSVTTMAYCFANAEKFNQPIDSFTTAKVLDMACLFRGASAFNQTLEHWVTSSVTNMDWCFFNAAAFTHMGGIERCWDTSKVCNNPTNIQFGWKSVEAKCL